MTSTAPIPPITGTLTVAVPVEQAFRVFTWQINGTWQFDPDPDHASEIEVRFTANGPAETVVDVEHSRFDRLDGGGTINDAIRGGGGWTTLLAGFATTVTGRG